MRNTINLKSNFVVFGVPILLILTLIVIVKSSFFVPQIANFVIVDFVLVIPLVYFLLIRNREISNKTAFSVAFLGLAIASFVLPKDNQEFLSKLRVFLLPLVELFLVVYIVIKGRKVYKKVKAINNKSLDFYDILQQVCVDIFPKKLGSIVAVEFSMIYFGLFNWKKKVLQKNEFSYHKDSTAVSVILGFLLVVFVEMFVTHTMMKKGNLSGSIILGGLSAYTALQVVSVLRSLSKRPVFIDVKNKQLVLKFGILAKAIIPFEQIKSVELYAKEIEENSSIKYFSPIGSAGGHNILLKLYRPMRFEVFYGFTRKAQEIAVFIDKKVEFVNVLNSELKYEVTQK